MRWPAQHRVALAALSLSAGVEGTDWTPSTAYDPSKHYQNTYQGNNALRFHGKDYVRVLHDSVMNAPLMDSWTIECWVKIVKLPAASAKATDGDATAGGQECESDTLNLVGFHRRHPTLAITRDGHAYTSVRDFEMVSFGYQGTTNLADGQYHHIAATWNGTVDAKEQTLSLYVDGKLETAGGACDSSAFGLGEGQPKHPASGQEGQYNAAAQCEDDGGHALCEEGMHIGGFYQSGSGHLTKPYTGQFFDGVIDEVRVWTAPRTQKDIQDWMRVPLRPSDHMKGLPTKGLLFYFPFDEQGDDTGDTVFVESRALAGFFGFLGNASGAGRPTFQESGAPLTCTVDSLARPCVEYGVGNTRESLVRPAKGASPTAVTSFLRRRYSHGTMAAAVLLTMLFSAGIAIVLTRAVLVDGLELSLSLSALPVAGGALARAVKGLVGGGGGHSNGGVPHQPIS